MKSIIFLVAIFIALTVKGQEKGYVTYKTYIEGGIRTLDVQSFNRELKNIDPALLNVPQVAVNMAIGSEWQYNNNLIFGVKIGRFIANRTAGNDNSRTSFYASKMSLGLGYNISINDKFSLSPIIDWNTDIYYLSFEGKSDNNTSLSSVYNDANAIGMIFRGRQMFISPGITVQYAFDKRFAVELYTGYNLAVLDGDWKYAGNKIDTFPRLNGAGLEIGVRIVFMSYRPRIIGKAARKG
jgi:hypothetical protein